MQMRLIDALKKQIGSLEKENKEWQTKYTNASKFQASGVHDSGKGFNASGMDYHKQAFEKLTKTKDMYEKTIAELNAQLYEERKKSANLELELSSEKFKSGEVG